MIADATLKRHYSSTLWLIIGFSTAIRIALSALLNLGNDEVYYFTYAVQPDWNHFDHPPLVGLFIRLATLNLTFVNDVTMRLPALFGAAINTWLISKCAQRIVSERAGLFAAILYNTALYTSIISGLFILPDSIQLVFWLAALYTMIGILEPAEQSQHNRSVLWMGIWIGLAMMCKIHGIFLWIGCLGFIVFHQRAWLKNPYLYGAILLTVILISPIIFWNINNDFITWQFHSERVTVNQSIDLKSFLVTCLGQIGYANPISFLIYVISIVGFIKKKNFVYRTSTYLLLWCSLPIIVSTTLISLFRATLPHWSGPGFLGFMILSSAYIDYGLNKYSKVTYRLLMASVYLIFFVCMAGPLLIHFYRGTLSQKPFPETGLHDPTLDVYGWDELLPAFSKIRQADIAQNRMTIHDPLVTHNWFPGGHMYFYVAFPLKMRFIGLGNLNELHKFHWLNSIYGTIPVGANAYYITPSNNFKDPQDLYGDSFLTITKIATITQKRSGQTARYWYVYRLIHAKPGIDSSTLAYTIPKS